MHTIQDVYKFYCNTLMPDINELELKRKKVAGNLFTIGILFAGLVFLFEGILFKIGVADITIYGLVALAGAVIYGFVFHLQTRNYKCDFKLKIINPLVKFINPALNYEPQACVPMDVFKASGLFRQRVDRYRGDDFVFGVMDKTEIAFSELHAEYETRDSKGNRHYHTVFKGLFFTADFNKDFKGTTFVLPDRAEKLLGSIGSMFQKANKTRGDLVQLEDPAFEKEFAVYSDDQIEARYILSHSLMTRILEFKNKSKKRISIAFRNSNVYVAIPYVKDLFEPRVFCTLIDFEPIKDYYHDLSLAVSIVEDMNLNTRIWSKE